MSATNHHASCLLIGEAGVLITGPSGSGKSLLTLALVDRAAQDGRFAALVADDQVFLGAEGGRLLARAPASIAGLAERWGLGVVKLPHEAAAVIRLVVSLSTEASLTRMPAAGESVVLDGIDVPLLRVPRQKLELSVPLVLGALAGLSGN